MEVVAEGREAVQGLQTITRSAGCVKRRDAAIEAVWRMR